MTESKHIWAPLRDNLRDPHWERIENSAGRGRPDVNGCLRGHVVDVELKIFHGRQLVFREGQPVWIHKRAWAGGRVFVLARAGDVLYLYQAVEVVGSSVPRTLLANGDTAYTVLDVVSPLCVCPRPFNWKALQAYMFFGDHK